MAQALAIEHSKYFAKMMQSLLSGTALLAGVAPPKCPGKFFYGLKCNEKVSCPLSLQMHCFVAFEKFINDHEMIC